MHNYDVADIAIAIVTTEIRQRQNKSAHLYRDSYCVDDSDISVASWYYGDNRKHPFVILRCHNTVG